jgi:two-component system CheB/CheR fusion protein
MRAPVTDDPQRSLEELQHRTRNMLALMRSFVRRTLARNPGSKRAALLVARLDAISRIHAIIIRDPGAPVSLRELIDQEVQTVRFPPEVEVTIEGPAVDVRASTAQIMGLAIHELVGNSVEHGAIGRGAGSLSIEWGLGEDGSLDFRWREQSAARSHKPRSGFGTDLLLNALPYELKARPALQIRGGRVDFSINLPVR